MNKPSLVFFASWICAACQSASPHVATAPTALTLPSAAAAAPPATTSPVGAGHGDEALAAARVIVASPDRDESDRALDAGRRPAETLAFFGIAPGMHVAELVAGGGYTSELLARAVGPSGIVYGQNPKAILGFAEKPWSARLSKPVLKNVVRVDRDLDAPLPAEAKDLDAVLIVLTYHDTVWMGVDRAKMNAAVFAALKHGGVYGIVDHSARLGTGLADVKTLHRIDEKALRAEVESAGFRLDAEADFLRNATDARDWSDSPRVAGERRGTSDRFVLRFVKP
jgi:predicted methyltransferase